MRKIYCASPIFGHHMLTQLHIRNYAIIKQVDIAFHPNLTIITGETGAGKSILMGALSLILGDRADSKSLLNANDKCVIEGTFNLKGYDVSSFFEQEELDYDTTCILRREIAPSGKSRAFINDTPVTLNQLKELGSMLVDVVSQHQTLDLNNSAFQLQMVDAIAGSESTLKTYQETYKQFKQTEKLLADLTAQEAQARTDEDYLTFILNELAEVNPIADEQTELEKQLDVLSHAESIQQSAGAAFGALSGDEQSILDALRQLKSVLSSGSKYHQGLGDLVTRIDSSMIELKDVADELAAIAESTQANPQELERIETRLQVLFNLHKKHRVANNEELLHFMQSVQEKLTNIGSLASQIEEQQTALTQLEKALSKHAEELSKKRKKAIPQIIEQVNVLLNRVKMPDAQINISQEESAAFGPTGKDSIELLFAANKGSSFQPIQKVASGGELSRLMLCIKSLVSDKVALPTIVFDEIDTGISGEAALKVSEVLKEHASKHQVIAITHLPQIAGKADAHLFVYKTSNAATTHTHIKSLSEQERVEEIARMMHGANPSEKVLEAAKELMKN